MFRDEYRKANDSIHAPDHLLESIKNEAERSYTADTRPKPRWPSIVIYSGCAAAVAVLALLVIRPFGFMKSAAPAAASAEAKAYDTAAVAEESMELFVAGGSNESPMLMAPAAEAPAETAESESAEAVFDRVERTDGDEDEYYIFNAADEMTYDDIFGMLTPDAAQTQSSKKASITESASADVWIEGNVLHAFGNAYDLPERRSICALAQAWDNVYVISEEEGFVVTSVYSEHGYLGEAKQSGRYVAYEVKETTVFDDDYRLSDHQVVMVTSVYAPDLSAADVSDPATFVPLYSDQNGERPLDADDVTCLDASSAYSVYGAVEVSDGVTMLYIFAELG